MLTRDGWACARTLFPRRPDHLLVRCRIENRRGNTIRAPGASPLPRALAREGRPVPTTARVLRRTYPEPGVRFAPAPLMRIQESRNRSSDPAADNIRAIVEVERQAAREASLGERIGQAISDRIGTMGFVLLQGALMAAWIAWNSLASPSTRFDPYPFGLLTFIVSLEGVLIATFVLLAQNRMSRQSDERNHLNLQISLLAEQEMTLMLKLLRRLAERFDVSPETEQEARAEKLTEETNVYELVRTLREELQGQRPADAEP